MVLVELGKKIEDIISEIKLAKVVDKNLIDEVLGTLGEALKEADVNFRQIEKIISNISAKFSDIEEKSGDKRLQVIRLVENELKAMLSTVKKPYEMKKNKQNIIMFVGLQGSGKTTTCTKYANYYQKKGFKVGLVCADTFKADAFDQLRENSEKCGIDFYGSYTENNPIKIANDGIQHFKKLKFQIIIVDTSGSNKQEDSVFEEMRQLATAIKPDDIVFIMDSHNGQACYDQAIEYQKFIDVGSVIITKLDDNRKGGGALFAGAATEIPIIFIGNGKDFDDFESYDAESFINELLKPNKLFNQLLNDFSRISSFRFVNIAKILIKFIMKVYLVEPIKTNEKKSPNWRRAKILLTIIWEEFFTVNVVKEDKNGFLNLKIIEIVDMIACKVMRQLDNQETLSKLNYKILPIMIEFKYYYKSGILEGLSDDTIYILNSTFLDFFRKFKKGYGQCLFEELEKRKKSNDCGKITYILNNVVPIVLFPEDYKGKFV